MQPGLGSLLEHSGCPWGAGASRAIKVFIIHLVAFCDLGCKPPQPSPGPPADAYDAVDEFWSSSINPGFTHRAFGFNKGHGIYCYWEHSDIGPGNTLHTARGEFVTTEDGYQIHHPFGESMVLERTMISGVWCLIPAGVALESARHDGWLLIHRDGASPENPFGLYEDTVFDKFPGPSE